MSAKLLLMDNELGKKLKYILLPITVLEIFTLLVIGSVHYIIYQYNISYHKVWDLVLFFILGYLQFQFYNILNYNERYQGRIYTAIILLKSLLPTMGGVMFLEQNSYLVDDVYNFEYQEKIFYILIFYFVGLALFTYVFIKSDTSYYHLIKIFPKLKR